MALAVSTMSEPRSATDAHVLLVSMGLYGHLNPFILLARRLMDRGIVCTMLVDEMGRWCLEKSLKERPLHETHRFQVEWTPAVKGDSTMARLENWRQTSEPCFERLVESRAKGAKGPTCIVGDQFAGWTDVWAAKLAIKRYFFICSPTLFAYFSYNLSTFIRRDRILDRINEDPVLDLPGAPKLRLSDSPKGTITSPEVFYTTGDTYDNAAGILTNSIHDLEAPIIEKFLLQLQAAAENDAKKCPPQWVLPIGPIISEPGLDPDAGDDSTKDSESPCIQWLDSRALGSVLFIAFGTMHSTGFDKAQIHELASALEATKVSFLWVLMSRDISEHAGVSMILPAGFLERTSDRGLVYPHFAPQQRVLAHPATGTFLTHCGWNSVLESVTNAVPLIPWPRGAEQKMCCRLLQSAGLEAHVSFGKGVEAVLVESAELEELIRRWALDGAGRSKLKATALKLQQQAMAAVAPGGSSYENFERFMREISSC